jgi:hypothetical protein
MTIERIRDLYQDEPRGRPKYRRPASRSDGD